MLGGDEHVVTLLLAVFSVGVAAGSLACERLSGHKVELGLVPFGSIGLTVFAIDLYFAAPRRRSAPSRFGGQSFLRSAVAWRVMADLFLLGLFGGFYIVPLYALIQSRSEPQHRSRIIAGNNILNACFMVAASLAAIGFLQAGAVHPAADPGGRAGECRGGAVHLPPGPGIPPALRRLAHDPFGLSPGRATGSRTSRRRAPPWWSATT